MSNQGKTPDNIADVFRFAAGQCSMNFEVPLAAFERLADQLVSSDGVVVCQVQGFQDPERGAIIELQLAGKLVLRCQRCLTGLDWDLAVRTRLQPIRPGQALPEDELEDDEVDAFEVDGELDVHALIEDEIILALPIAPRHDECGTLRPEGAASKESPFAVLAGLRGNGSAA